MTVIFSLIVLAVAIAIYFVPYIIALKRNATNTFVILMVNLWLGWTVLGWLAALFLAVVSQTTVAVEIERETLRQLKAKQQG